MAPTHSDFPIPPPDLLDRIGPMGDVDPVSVYEQSGAGHRDWIVSALPDDWDWTGRRVLDFGSGVGRVLRQFGPESETAEFWGCDIDSASIEWSQQNLSPPFHFFESEEAARLPQEDGYFDLIYALSVYTHFTDNWAGWLLEHHRVLKDDGLLLVTFLGKGMSESLIQEPWDEDRTGMNVLLHGNPWRYGGPVAFNSAWWIEAHWGRAFEILHLDNRLDAEGAGHGYALMRKRPVELTEEDLKRLEPDEPREVVALQHQVEQLRDETLRIRPAFEAQQAELDHLHRSAADVNALKNSRSWRMTAPMRRAAAAVRARR